MSEPTIEELQNQILELQQANEQKETELNSLKRTHQEDQQTIKQVREVNSKLFQQASFGNSPFGGDEEVEVEKETPEEFLDSFIQPAKANLEKTFGVKFNGYTN